LTEIKHLIDYISANGPTINLGGLDTGKLASGLRETALKYGRR
jgi:hypothetical protein